jgi:class 3 adenylate cyclase
MNYDGLEKSYWDQQIERVTKLRDRIVARAEVVPGRVTPDDTDLVIGTGRRINAAVMFTDISGFSTRQSISQEEQEMMLRVLNLYFTEMIRIVEDYGGSVEKNTGDGLMAYFEDGVRDTREENSIKRAVACSLTMDATNALLIQPILRASGVPPITFRTSIEYGSITVARIGAPSRFNANVAIGNAANFAAKMLPLIKAGEIGLGGRAHWQLPEPWRQQWTRLADVNTGWVYVGTTNPYPLYLYTGRWARLL